MMGQAHFGSQPLPLTAGGHAAARRALSIRSKGLIVIGALLLYAIAISLFAFDQKNQLLREFEDIQGTLQTEALLKQADLSAFHGVIAIFAATLDYLKTRQQFGAPIGKFQALQHCMADMFIHLEQARSMAMLAAARADSDDVFDRRRTVSAAKARVGLAATFIGQQAVQLHGGMGVTDELPAAHHFKRLSMIALTLGDVEHHIERFIAQPGFLPTETA